VPKAARPEDRWEFSTGAARYRDLNNGRFIAKRTVDKMQTDFLDARADAVDDLASGLVGGDLTVQRWLEGMRDEVKVAHIGQYMFGRGGRNAMTDSDWGRVGQVVRQQYAFLQNFAEQVADGVLSESQIRVRASMYVDAAHTAFGHGLAQAKGWPDLPAMPGDGSTVCLTNCDCDWVVEPVEGGWNCTWELGNTDHCDDCVGRADAWAPLFIADAASLAA
jgi:hypothetical protein